MTKILTSEEIEEIKKRAEAFLGPKPEAGKLESHNITAENINEILSNKKLQFRSDGEANLILTLATALLSARTDIPRLISALEAIPDFYSKKCECGKLVFIKS